LLLSSFYHVSIPSDSKNLSSVTESTRLTIRVPDLLLNYSQSYLEPEEYRVEKMTFGKRDKDKTTIVYNSYINLSEIPLEDVWKVRRALGVV
jgi:hypothetical protein